MRPRFLQCDSQAFIAREVFPKWRNGTDPAREQEENRRLEKLCKTIKQDAVESYEISYIGSKDLSAKSKFPA
jgi:hypothetical protein